MAYLGWMDDNPHRTPTDKLRAAIAAYVERFGVRPLVVRVNDQEPVPDPCGLQVVRESYIRRNNFYVGMN